MKRVYFCKVTYIVGQKINYSCEGSAVVYRNCLLVLFAANGALLLDVVFERVVAVASLTEHEMLAGDDEHFLPGVETHDAKQVFGKSVARVHWIRCFPFFEWSGWSCA